MCVHYDGIKSVCGAYSGAPVKVALYVTCYITRRVVVVHIPDELRINGGCTNFYFFVLVHGIH